MRRRVLTFLLAGLVVLGSVLGCVPMRAGAIVPLGFVQSALASYVSSTGYKLYNDNGTGQDILGSLGELYDDYVTVSNKTITGQLANLAFLANSPYIYQDNSGQIVVSKVAADIFQGFADWIQTEYSVPVGSDTPTEVLTASGQFVTNGSTFTAFVADTTGGTVVRFGARSVRLGPQVGTYNGSPLYIGSFNSANAVYYLTLYSDGRFSQISAKAGNYPFGLGYVVSGGYALLNDFSNSATQWQLWTPSSGVVFDLPTSSELVSPSSFESLDTAGGVLGLGVTLAQAVADVVGQAKEDDAVVIGVGASAGATAQDIADMVAQGVKAQTLNPSVSITAESVIDTPVQPYPDIDGLGLPELGAALVSRFPFCIPWDFVDTVKLLNAEPVAPDIAVDLFPAAFKSKVGISGSTEFRINLGDEKYQKIGVFCRWGSLIGFCFGLAMLTKRMIWTA